MIGRSAVVCTVPIHRVARLERHECGHYKLLLLLLLCGGSCYAGDLLGRASCAASTCHGGVIDQGPKWNHAFSTWAALDPHAGAGLLLRDDDSRSIVLRLEPRAGDSAAAFDTVLRQRCLSCHATTSPEQCTQSGLLDDAILAAGVACESCHGPAGNWLQPHLQMDWSGPQRFDSSSGMIDTESIMGRAESCVRCHIGSRAADGMIRDLNHDLIAAGHPALRFDLLIYHENLPQHWAGDSPVERRFNESAVRLRKVGRAINLAAAASLAAERARDHLKDPVVPWPELADYDCFACHQSLSIEEFQLPPTAKPKSPLHVSNGLPIWNAWHTLNQLDLESKRSTLEALSPHRSDPSRIAAQGEQLAVRYRTIAAARGQETVAARDALKSPLMQLQARPPIDWHHAAIQYLEIDAALRDLASDRDTAAIGRPFLEALRGCEPLLRFDRAQSADVPARYHSPATFDAQAFRMAVLGLFKVSAFKQPTTPAKSLPTHNASPGSDR